MHSKSRTALAATTLAVGVVLAPAAQATVTAPAPKAPSGCESGYLCGYAGAGYKGAVTLLEFHHSSAHSEPGLDKAGSVYNNVPLGEDETGQRGGWCWRVYNRADFAGKSLVVKPNTGVTPIPASFGRIMSDHTEWCRLS